MLRSLHPLLHCVAIEGEPVVEVVGVESLDLLVDDAVLGEGIVLQVNAVERVSHIHEGVVHREESLPNQVETVGLNEWPLFDQLLLACRLPVLQ